MPETSIAATQASLLGPSVMATLLCADAGIVVAAYTEYLGLQASEHQVSAAEALSWGAPALGGAPCWLLANALGDCWLRIIEDPHCTAPKPLAHTGWLALEISVQDVDTLAASLQHSPFDILRPPANLELSDQIRAMQVAGPAGEVLYLTQIKGSVPPFELEPARCAVDRLFIPVLCTHQRDDCLAFYEQLAGRSGISFDTRITVLNQAYGYELARRHPVATLQLAKNSLVEIDQLAAAHPPDITRCGLPAGVAMLSFLVDDVAAVASRAGLSITEPQRQPPYLGRRSIHLRGAAGEHLELIERH